MSVSQLPETIHSVSTTNICRTDNDFDRPSGTGSLCIATQALRAWILSWVSRERSGKGGGPILKNNATVSGNFALVLCKRRFSISMTLRE